MDYTLLYSTNAATRDRPEGYPRMLVLVLNVTQDFVNLTSTVNYTLKVDGTISGAKSVLFYRELPVLRWNLSVGLAWQNIVELDNWRYEDQVSTNQVLSTGSFTVQHNQDGTFPYAMYLYGTAGFLNDTYTYDDTLTFPTNPIILASIPRVSSVTCPTTEVGRNPIININSPSTLYTHTLWYEFGSLMGIIASNLPGGNYSGWSIPTSFLNEIPDQKYGMCTLHCDTYLNGTLNGSASTTFRVNIPSTYAPNVSPVIKDINETTLALTGDESKIIKYFNTISYDVGAFTRTGSTITSTSITCGDASSSSATGYFYNVESGTFVVSASDSRGYSTTETVELDFVPYIKPTIKLQLIDINTNGTGSIAISGNFFGGSFGAVDNQTVVSYRVKENYEDWGEWQEVVYNITNDSYYAEIQLQGLDYQSTYTYQARVADKLMTVDSNSLVVRAMPVFDWGEEDFQFNVPVKIEGNLTVTGTITSANPSTEAVTPADYVIENGASGIWNWRKWNSGFMELWGQSNISCNITTAWGSLYTSGAIAGPDFPFTFAQVPKVIRTIETTNAGGIMMAPGGSNVATVSNPGAYEIARGTSVSGAVLKIDYYVVGYWK